MSPHRFLLRVSAAALLWVVGCGGSTAVPSPAATSVPTPNAESGADAAGLSGRLIIVNSSGYPPSYYQMTLGEETTVETISQTDALKVFSPGQTPSEETDFMTSISGNQVLITKRDNSMSAVVDTQDNQPLVPDGLFRDCTSVSPDGTRWAVVTEKGVYLTGADGRARQVMSRPSATYHIDPVLLEKDPIPETNLVWVYFTPGKDIVVNGEVSCPAWLSRDRLLVDRVKGDFPKTASGGSGIPDGRANTTSVIELTGDKVEINDVQERWWLISASPDFKWAIMRKPKTSASPYTVDPKIGSQWQDYVVEMDWLTSGKGNPPTLLTPCAADLFCEQFRFSDDVGQVAYFAYPLGDTTGAGSLHVWDIGRKTESAAIDTKASGNSLIWSPDGDAIAYTIPVYSSGSQGSGMYVALLKEERVVFLPAKQFGDTPYVIAWQSEASAES